MNNIIIKCLAAVPALALTAGTALAQDFTAGKTPAQLFASDCSACHRSPDGLGKKYKADSLTGFLRAHYTTKQETAGSLAKYVMGFATLRPVATTSPTAEDARLPDGKHRSDVSSDGEKKPRAKPPGTAANDPPVPQPAAQPAAAAEATVHPPARGAKPQARAGTDSRSRRHQARRQAERPCRRSGAAGRRAGRATGRRYGHAATRARSDGAHPRLRGIGRRRGSHCRRRPETGVRQSASPGRG